MRLVLISDTHNLNFVRGTPLDVPDGDVLVHCGDATLQGTYSEVADFATWFSKFPHKHKIFVPGNHDWAFYYACKRDGTLTDGMQTMLDKIDWAHVLIDQGVTIDGVKFWGSPWQPEFMGWAFNLPRGLPLKEKWDLIPAGTDVLVTHGPPMGILDRVGRQHVGCADLLNAVHRVKPQLHAFGHVHAGYGTMYRWGIEFVNCATADEAYFLRHKPVVVDL